MVFMLCVLGFIMAIHACIDAPAFTPSVTPGTSETLSAPPCTPPGHSTHRDVENKTGGTVTVQAA